MISLKNKVKLVSLLSVLITLSSYAVVGSADISEDSKSIGYGAYRNRKDIVLVIIPSSVESIHKNAFVNCPNIVSISFDDEDDWYITQDESNWRNKSMGTHIDVSDPSSNVSAFRSGKYFFYKSQK
ncbi:MAG: leucine-rich repeat domain-containing protein [Treponema sp.]|nr:leucine-rich repeat domain-containing protein [Treponema sp.]